MDIAFIKQIFKDNGVPLDADDAWKVQTTWVIKHKALERLAAKFQLVWDRPQIIRSERDECVILVSATRPDNQMSEWSIGECAIALPNGYGNYKVKPGGGQAAYPYAMAEKRGKDRVILKLAGLHGAYSEEEADAFVETQERIREAQEEQARQQKAQQQTQRQDERKAAPDSRPAVVEEAPPADGPDLAAEELMQLEGDLKKQIDEAETIKAVTDLMLTPKVQGDLARLGNRTDAVRDYAKARLVALGWPKRAGRGGQQASAA